ncbi:MAG: ACP S-malonyltransferase [Pseudomonadota bacterium]
MKRAVVICPGRGTYNKSELGYLARHFPDADLLGAFDAQRAEMGQESLVALDQAEKFSLAKHTRGDNASALIFASSLGDFLSIDRESIEVVAVTGNSMGWYTTLACAGAASAEDGFRIANTMGQLMQDNLTGGQVVYPFMGPEWERAPDRLDTLMATVGDIAGREGCELYPSIHLGGMLVLAGNEAGLKAFEAAVEPVQGRFPMRLGNHAAFHSPLLAHVAKAGRDTLPVSLLRNPDVPMIDGRGEVWWPHAFEMADLFDYTLRTQVIETYDFTRAITVAAREFAPDLFIVAGPGNTLGGAVAQSLICADWQGLDGKGAFVERQESEDPILASMGLDDQRGLVT